MIGDGFAKRLSLAGGLGFLALGLTFTLLLAILGSLLWGFIPYWPTFMLVNLGVLYLGWWGIALSTLWPIVSALMFGSELTVFLPANLAQQFVWLAMVRMIQIEPGLRTLDDRVKYVCVTFASSALGAAVCYWLFVAHDAPPHESLPHFMVMWATENTLPVIVPGIWLHKVIADSYQPFDADQDRRPKTWVRRTLEYAVPWMATLLIIGAMIVALLLHSKGLEQINVPDFFAAMRAQVEHAPEIRVAVLLLSLAILYSVGSAVQHAKQSWTLVEAVRRHLPNRRLSELLTGGAALPTEQRLVTIMFTDLRGFTETSAKFEPGDLVAWLNTYFTHMGRVCERNGGAIDKYIGDGIMIVFGLSSNDAQARRALLCAIEMLEALEEWQKESAAMGFPPVGMGVGIHSGTAIVGEIGSPQRRQYTVIGSVVNTAARLESASKDVPEGALPIVMSGEAARYSGLLVHPRRDELLIPFAVKLKGVADVDSALTVNASTVAELREIMNKNIAIAEAR